MRRFPLPAFVLSWLAVSPAFGDFTIGPRPDDQVNIAHDFPYESVLIADVPTHIAHGSLKLHEVLTDAFPDWTFVYSPDNLSGHLEIDLYDATTRGSTGAGANFRAIYHKALNEDPTLSSLHFIQIAWWNGNPNYPDYFLDNPDTAGENPFYYTEEEEEDYKTPLAGNYHAGTYTFEDGPFTEIPPPAGIAFNREIDFLAELYIASWDGDTTVTIYDGISWGFNGYRYNDGLGGGGNLSAVPGPGALVLMLVGLPTAVATMRKRGGGR